MKKKKWNRKKILGIIGVTSIVVVGTVVPIVVLNNRKKDDEKNKEDVETVVKLLKNKNIQEKTIELPINTAGKIIETNKKKIIDAIKKLITSAKLRDVIIDVSMKTDANISIDAQAIIVTIKKGKHSVEIKEIKIGDNKGFKVKRALTIAEQANADIKSAKTALEKLSQKTTIVDTRGAADQKITTNKAAILRAIKDISGYSDLVLKGVTVAVKNSEAIVPANSDSAVDVTLILTKIGGIQVEVTGFTVKQMSATQQANLDIKFVKSILDAKSSKLVQIKDSAKKVNALGVAIKIKNALETQVGSIDLKNVVIITISADTTNAIMDFSENGIGFIITLSKSNGTSVSITDWKVRLMTNAEIELETKQQNQVIIDDFFNFIYNVWGSEFRPLTIKDSGIGSNNRYTEEQLIKGIIHAVINNTEHPYLKNLPLLKLKQIDTQTKPAANGFYSVDYYTSKQKVILELYLGSGATLIKRNLSLYIKRDYSGIRTKK